jgi:2-dehydro-3-deoxyphosphogluconate aldolase / (4S)-4-hydroxy-2-oxoglutarate aldolase
MRSRRAHAVILELLKTGGVVPVVRAESSETAVRVAEALIAGGVRTIEITMTVPNAFDAMRAVAQRFGHDVLLGAGTVTDAATVGGALDAGSEFIVTPCVVPEVIRAAHEQQVPVLPGALTPTEVFTAWSLGADIVKVFPASHLGGPSYLKALKGPFPQIPVCPTGGVNLDTIGEFIAAGAAAVGVGGELVLKSAIATGDYGRITTLARQYVEAVQRARGA